MIKIIKVLNVKIRHVIFPVFLLLIISCSPLRIYRDLPEVKTWESEIRKFTELNRIEKYDHDAIVFAGSSSIRLWKTLAGDLKPYSVIQRGYGGAKLSDYGVYAEKIFDDIPGRALVLFIANDITGSEKDKSPQEVKRLFMNLVKTFRKSHPGAPVFWIAITPTSSRWKAWPDIKKANELIRETCDKRKKLYFIPTEHAFLNEKGLPRDELFVADKLHLNEEGYKVWTEIVKMELDKVFKD